MASRQRNAQERACEETLKKGEKKTPEVAQDLRLRISDCRVRNTTNDTKITKDLRTDEDILWAL